MPVHTPGAINSAGPDDQGAQQTNLAVKYPNSVDALAGMQYPDMPGGPDGNAPRSPDHQAHPTTRMYPYVPGTNVEGPEVGTGLDKVYDLPPYGTILGTQQFATIPEE